MREQQPPPLPAAATAPSPDSRLANPPGQRQLIHRIGDYYSFYDSMLHCLARQGRHPLTTTVPWVEDAEDQKTRAEQPRSVLGEQRTATGKGRIWLNLSQADNWILGLLRSWATIGEILAFYQERLINEGYLRTARERRSVHELARLLDYRPRPAVAGATELAFDTTDVEGLPRDIALVASTPVDSVPPEGAEPQSFETSGPLVARADWNRLGEAAPARPLPLELDNGANRLGLANQARWPDIGSGILIRGRQNNEERLFYRPVAALEDPAAKLPGKDLVWSEAVELQPAEPPLGDLEVYALRQELRLFGYAAPLWPEQSLAVRRRYRDLQGGLRVLQDGSWRATHGSLPEAEIRCLVYSPDGHLFAGTSGQGIWRLSAGEKSWQGPSRGLELGDICALTATDDGLLIAGTATGGVFHSTDGGDVWTQLTGRALGRARWTLVRRSRRLDSLPQTPVRALLSLPTGEGAAKGAWLFAGTDSGLYRSTDLANTWMPSNRGFPAVDSGTGETSTAVTALIVNPLSGELFAATSAGVFSSTDRGRRWQAINLGLPEMDLFSELLPRGVRDLALHYDRRRRTSTLFAATTQGIYRSRDRGNNWQLASSGLEIERDELPEITCLALERNKVTVTSRLFAATAERVWCSLDEGESWRPASLDALPGGRALAASSSRATLAAATPFGGFANNQWPNFFLSRGHIDLEREIPALPADGWVILVPDADQPQPPPVGIFPLLKVSTVRRTDFTLNTKITRLQVDPDPALRRYDLRRTRVLVHSEPLLLQTGNRVDPRDTLAALCARLRQMPADRPILACALHSPGNHDSPVHEAAQSRAEPLANQAAWQYLSSSAAQLLASLEKSAQTGLLTLASEPTSSAKAGQAVAVSSDSLQVFANVINATEGVTIHREVLGSGNAAQTLQQFPLVEIPAFLRGSPDPRSTVEIRVGDQRWREVPRLLDQPPERRVYELRRDHQGFATVVFGDGAHGARLPTGQGNVVATYRFGTSQRPIPAASVRLMHSRPLGLAAVTNPRPGTPGAAAEPADQVRSQAPSSVRIFGRIVSLRDYEDFAAGYPGVVKVRAQRLSAAGQPMVHLTLATADAEHRPPRGSLFKSQLLAAIEAIRAAAEPVEIASFKPVGLIIEARILLRQGLEFADFEPHLRALLEQRFSFEHSDFGRTISPAEAIITLQEVDGVAAVDLDVFRRDEPAADTAKRDPEPPRNVVPREAYWDPITAESRPAELVLFQRCHLYAAKDALQPETRSSPPEATR